MLLLGHVYLGVFVDVGVYASVRLILKVYASRPTEIPLLTTNDDKIYRAATTHAVHTEERLTCVRTVSALHLDGAGGCTDRQGTCPYSILRTVVSLDVPPVVVDGTPVTAPASVVVEASLLVEPASTHGAKPMRTQY